MRCSICAAIPPALRANTGREEYLPPTTHLLKPYDLDSRNDLRECPTCGAFYHWQDDTAWTGSGNNDEERLTRFAEEHSVVARACLHRGETSVAETAARIEDALIALPPTELDLVLAAMRKRDRELARALMPRLVTELARTHDHWLRDRLCTFTWGTNGDAALILSLLERTPHPEKAQAAFTYVADRCREYLPKG